jgi:hypothetical protein
MHNQHAGLSQALAEQPITKRREQAAHAWLGRDARPAAGAGHGVSVAGGSWLGGQASPWSSQSAAPERQLTNRIDPEIRSGRAVETMQPHVGGAAYDRPWPGRLPSTSWRSLRASPPGM